MEGAEALPLRGLVGAAELMRLIPASAQVVQKQELTCALLAPGTARDEAQCDPGAGCREALDNLC